MLHFQISGGSLLGGGDLQDSRYHVCNESLGMHSHSFVNHRSHREPNSWANVQGRKRDGCRPILSRNAGITEFAPGSLNS
jgi:hypothetical protein